MIQNLFFKIKSYLIYQRLAVNAHGLHSPFVFDFYNEVIASKKEYYFFKRFRAILKSHPSSVSEKNLLFLYRWVAFFKPKSITVLEANFHAALALSVASTEKRLGVHSLADYQGKEMKLFRAEGVTVSEENHFDLIYLDHINADTIDIVSRSKCAIVYKPHSSKEKEDNWKSLCNSKAISISIDLFQFGILLTDRNQAKQHFIVKMS